MVGDLLQVPAALDADHGLPAEAEHQRVGHRDDLHDPGLDQPLDPLPDRGLGEPDRLADGGVGAAAVFLELLDYLLRKMVQDGARGAAPGGAPVPAGRYWLPAQSA